jgi:hypothetical protein
MTRRLLTPPSAISAFVVAMCLGGGCAQPNNLRLVAIPDDGLRSQLAAADAAASDFLQRSNTRPSYKDLDRPLELADYHRKTELAYNGKRFFLVVSYVCNRHLGVLDGASHFNVFVYLDNNQTEVLTE